MESVQYLVAGRKLHLGAPFVGFVLSEAQQSLAFVGMLLFVALVVGFVPGLLVH